MGWEKGGVLQTFSSDFAQPKWAPPAVDPNSPSTQTITVVNGQSTYAISDEVDLIVVMPTTKFTATGGLNLTNNNNSVRHIVIIGGEISQDNINGGNPSEAQGLGITANNYGTFHVEGLWIHGNTLTDGIQLYTQGRIQVVNCRIEGCGFCIPDPTSSGIHSDVIQALAGGEIRIDYLSGTTWYQGVTIENQFGGIYRTHLDHIDIVGNNPTGWTSGVTWLLSQLDNGSVYANVPMWIGPNVYLKPSSFTGSLQNTIANPNSVANADGSVSFPVGQNAYGNVKPGVPPNASFVQANTVGGEGVAGLKYISPGYSLPYSEDEVSQFGGARALGNGTFTQSIAEPASCTVDAAVFTTGFIILVACPVTRGFRFNNINFWITTVANTPTSGQWLCAVYSASGAKLATTADLSGSFNTTGSKAAPTTSSNIPITPVFGDSFIWVALMFNATTPPKLLGLNQSVLSGAGPTNIGRKSGYARSAFIGGGQTALPSSFTPSGLTMNITTPLVWLT